MEYAEALAWIHGRLPFGSRPGLERINGLLALLDNPQNKIKTIHIGGTNGKGSTVTFLRCLLESQGLKVGTFTSPYITTFNERISLNNQPISDEDLVSLVLKVQPLVAQLDANPALAGITEFEVITAMMFDYFDQQAVDVAIVEVGLGGTLDCTNVMTPLITGITTIGYDHMEILGSSLTEIASQKAGIIKAGRTVVTGKIVPEALTVIRERAVHTESEIAEYQTDYQLSQHVSLGTKGEAFVFNNFLLSNLSLCVPLLGAHQIENAGVALELFCRVMPLLGRQLNQTKIALALEQAQWPGRMEKIQEKPLLILDGAHNEPAIYQLVDNLVTLFPQKRLHIVFAAIASKDVTKMLQLLHQLPAVQVYVTTFAYPRAAKITEQTLKAFPKMKVLVDWQTGIDDLVVELAEDEVMIVTGSLYFISQVRTYLLRGVERDGL